MSTAKESKTSAITKADNNVRASGDYIGELVFWSMSEAEPTRADLKQALINCGIEVSFLPGELSEQQAFTRATAELKKHAERKDNPVGVYFVKRVFEDNDEIVVAVVKGKHDKVTKDTAVNLPNHFTFNKKTSEVTAATDLFKAEFMNAYEYACTHYTHNDIRGIALSILREFEAVCVRESGGLYFVPRVVFDTDGKGHRIEVSTSPSIDCIQSFMESPLIGKNTFGRLALSSGDSQHTGRTVSNVFSESILSDLKAMNERLDDAEGSKTSRTSFIRDRFDQLQLMRQQADLYRTVLKHEFKEVGAEMEKVEDRMKKALGLA